MNNLMKPYIKIAALFIVVILAAQPSKACMCMNSRDIDSLAQLNEYNFIALVKITYDQIFKHPSEADVETIGQLTFEIIELFKGERIGKILEYSKNSSCDIGISKGEEWILFGKNINGNISIVACDRNQRYKAKNEQRDWKYGSGFYELNILRRLYEHPAPSFENEKVQAFYKTGKIELEETYVNGKLNGERKIWYPNGQLFCKQFYINDTLEGKSAWFYKSGQIYDEDYYIMGKPCNV